MEMITDWPSLAACRNGDPDALFVQGAEQNIAKRVCRGARSGTSAWLTRSTTGSSSGFGEA